MTQFASPTLTAPDYDSAIIGALELSEKKWALAVQLPGVKRPATRSSSVIGRPI